jgi:hypothetical protein
MDVAIAAVVSGSIAGFLTNSLEYFAVNKQVNPNFKVLLVLKEKGILNKLFFHGCLFRTVYYGL